MNLAAKTAKTARDPLYDVIKGLSIIAIVLGHCPPNAAVCNFVYSFHLAIFVFVSGMQINADKYTARPWELVSSRLRSMWPAYFIYMSIFSLTRRFFTLQHLLPWNNYIETSEILPRIANNFVLQGSETFGGATWFVPMLLMTVALFAGILWVSRCFRKFYLIPAGILSVLGGIWGLQLCADKVRLAMYLHTALLMLPVMYAGFLLTCLKVDKKKVLVHTILAVGCGVLIWFWVLKPGVRIGLASNEIGSPRRFYIISFAGICLICALAKWLCKLKATRLVFAWIGKYSFDIMAMHFLIFKLVDWVWNTYWPDPDVSMPYFPCSDTARWPVYLLLSITVPPLLRMVFDLCVKGIGAVLRPAAK